MPNFDDLNDSLDDMLDAPAAPRKLPPLSYVKPETYFDKCEKCGGSGQTRWGPCFKCKCKGKGGKSYKTSPESRAKNRQDAAERKAKTLADNAAEFQTAHPEIIAWIAANPNFEFAKSMSGAIAKYGSLTKNQIAACERCIARDAQRKANREAEAKARAESAKPVDVSKIEAAFANARSKADRPGAKGVWTKPLNLQSGEHTLTFSPGSESSQWAGTIFVKSGDKKLGSAKGGKFTRRLECSDAEEAAVLDACGDPLKAAIAYGKAWSCCAVCGLTLTNDKSIEIGIGPICREKMGW